VTVKKNVQVIPEKRNVTFVAEAGGIILDARIYPSGVFSITYRRDGQSVDFHTDDLDALIELLHAVKAHAADPLDIIAVEEPTA
jgi:hypothetical protein